MAAPQTSSRVNAVTFDSSTNGDRGDQAREVRSVIPEEKPKRKSQNVTQKYDRKLMRVRLGLEEWMDEQLRELYECDDDEDYPIEIDIDEILSLNNEERRKEVETLLRDATQPTQEFISELLTRVLDLEKKSHIPSGPRPMSQTIEFSI